MATGRILLVEDSPELRLILKKYAYEAAVMMDAADTGEEALDFFRARDYDLVFLDLHLPGGLDGFQIFAAMKKAADSRGRKRPPVVALTASSFPEDREKCRTLGFEEFVQKPFRRSDMMNIFRRYLRAGTGAGAENVLDVDEDVADLLPGYVRNREKDLGEMRRFRAAGDLASVEAISHKVKGSAGAYGLGGLGEISGRIELLARAGRPEEVGTALDEFEAFLLSLQPLLEGLEKRAQSWKNSEGGEGDGGGKG